MPSVEINGPGVKPGVHNLVLQDALIHSPTRRLQNPSSYAKVEVGVREGDHTEWVGSFDQSEQEIEAGAPTSIMDEGRLGMRLRASQALVVRVTTAGSPATLVGARVNFRVSRVGGRTGPARPLVSSGGASVGDPNSRVALAALERQISSGLAEWEEGVQLRDPVEAAPAGTFQGRLQVDSTTQISLQRYAGNWVEVDGEAVSLGSDGLALTTSDNLLTSTGVVGSQTPGSNTLYYVYLSTEGDLRLSATAPTALEGVYYLGTTDAAAQWRFCGWAYLNSSTQFTDDETNRHLANYYNRLKKHVELKPAYNDNNAATSYTTTSTSWTPANAGTGATGSYIANGEDAVTIHAHATCTNNNSAATLLGIGENSTSTASSMASDGTTSSLGSVACSWSGVPAEGYRTVTLLIAALSGTSTFYADYGRVGGSVDAPATALFAEVMV